ENGPARVEVLRQKRRAPRRIATYKKWGRHGSVKLEHVQNDVRQEKRPCMRINFEMSSPTRSPNASMTRSTSRASHTRRRMEARASFPSVTGGTARASISTQPRT